jgi:ribosome biogenesis GTPase
VSKRRKSTRQDVTADYLAGHLDEDRLDAQQRFNKRSKFHQQNKTIRTTQLRLNEAIDVSPLPIGRVIQVHSLYVDLKHEERTLLATVRKTLNQVSDTSVVVGDFVRFSPADSQARSEGISTRKEPEAVIEAIEPRSTLLTRSDSFKAIEQHPIVANAQQMLIVASVAYPTVKWGLIDRMLIAAQAGGLAPIFCLNKLDVAAKFPHELEFAREAIELYRSIGVECIETSVDNAHGIDRIRELLKDKITVLAGHSGVGKSSLIGAVQPDLDIRIGAISNYNQKGRHTTTSARIYPLEIGGDVIDTPGVKLFGLWNVTRDNLLDFFPDIEAETAPEWRQESYARIEASLPE